MKILYLMLNNEISGGNRIIFEQSNRLIDRGHDVHIWYCGWTHNVSWHEVKAKEISVPKEVDSDYDVVVITYFETYFAAKTLPQLSNSKKFYLVQGREPYFVKEDSWKKRVEKTYADKSINFIAISKQLQEWLREDYNICADYIPNGLNLEVFKPTDLTIIEKPNKPVILLEGSFQFWLKGVADALTVLFELRKEGYDFEIWHMTKDSGSLFGVNKTINFPPQEYIPQIYTSADITLKASYMEGSPLPHMEAMACGSLLVTSDCVGTEEYCIDEMNCLKFETGNKNNMKERLKYALDNLKELKYIREYSLLYVKEKFDWEDKIDMLEKIFKRDVDGTVEYN